MLAAFVTAGLFYAGMAAVAVPVLIHLLNRRRFQRVRWAAMAFLLEAQRRNRRRIRIEEFILLALRCLAVFLLGAMLARWFVTGPNLWAMLGGGGQSERIILLDDSYSMTRIAADGGAGGTDGSSGVGDRLFDRAVAAVDTLVRTLREQAPADTLTLLVTSNPDRPVFVEPTVGGIDPGRLAAQLAGLEPSYRPARMPAAIEAVRRLLDSRGGVPSATLYILSDFQRPDWPIGEGSSGSPAGDLSSGPVAPLAAWTRQGHALQVVLVEVTAADRPNLSVTAIEARQPQAVAGVEARFHVRVSNFGAEPSPAVPLHSFVGDAAQPVTSVPAIPPGGHLEIPLEVTFPSPGSDVLAVELPADALPADNTRWHALEVARCLRVLVVNGERAADPYDDEVFLLVTALRPEGPQFSGNEITVIDETELEAADLGEYHVIVLANVYRVTESLAEKLGRYTAAGGGVIVFLGDQVDAEVYNRLLYREGRGLLPARLGEVAGVGPDEPGRGLKIDPGGHPLGERLAAGGAALLTEARVWQWIRCQPGPFTSLDQPSESTETGAPPATQPGDPPPAATLLRLDDPEAHPFALTRGYGQGQVALIASSADKEWNNLADQPGYLVWMMELVTHLARRPQQERDLRVGEPIRWILDPARFGPQAVLRPPTWPADPAVELPARPDPADGQLRIVWPQTDRPGPFQLELRDPAGQPFTETLAVNVDPVECDLTAVDRAALLSLWGDIPVEQVNVRALAGLGQEQRRREIWPLLFVLALAALTAEQGLAWYFGAGRRIRLLWSDVR